MREENRSYREGSPSELVWLRATKHVGGGCVRIPTPSKNLHFDRVELAKRSHWMYLRFCFKENSETDRSWLILLRGMFLTGEFPKREGKHSLSACSFSQEMSASKMACAPEAKISLHASPLIHVTYCTYVHTYCLEFCASLQTCVIMRV